MKQDAYKIINKAIKDVSPENAVKKALSGKDFPNGAVVVSIGKAAYSMAKAAFEALNGNIRRGVIVTKYGHSEGSIPGFEIIEAGHPLVDENSVLGAERALNAVSGLSKEDTVIFLVSGGGSALFEKPAEGVSLDDIIDVSEKLLACGADIVEINTIRKRLSAVKGGRFALAALPAKVYAIILSDVLGDRLDSIASGPAYPDSSTSEEAFGIIKKYSLEINENVKAALKKETPKNITNCETVITGSVRALASSAAETAAALGYKPYILSCFADCEAKELGKIFSSIAKSVREGSSFIKPPCAVITGGETVVRITGTGKGGRNQEIALSAALGLSELENVLMLSIGSDGTDGPTDAAGGITDCRTKALLSEKGISITETLSQNDSYNALKECGGLVITGPTGTNVNDLQVMLIK